MLPGRGGIGKTKLVREWAGRHASWNVLWTSEMRPWQAGVESEIPSGDTLLVVDDAHRYGDLVQAIGLVADWRGPQKLKMVITTRPSGRDYVNERLAQFVDETRVLRCPPLKELTLEETMELAEEMLGAGFAHLAPQLAQVSQDTPLVTVVGGRLIAKREILPDLLGNHEAFQHAVFDKFASECAGQLPAGGKSKEELSPPARGSTTGRRKRACVRLRRALVSRLAFRPDPPQCSRTRGNRDCGPHQRCRTDCARCPGGLPA